MNCRHCDCSGFEGCDTEILAHAVASAAPQIAAISRRYYNQLSLAVRKKTLRYDLKLIAVILIAVLSLAQSASADDWHFDNVDRVVAIADIHGAYDAMTATLQSAGVINADLKWIGDATHLVIVGDILDRGPDSRLAMDFLMRLEGEAESAGGKVHVLIGNHESMPMTGDLRYVSAAEYQAFAVDEDPDERARWLELYVQQQAGDAATVTATFDAQFPVGYFAMRRAFRADGRYGKWLLEKNIIVVLNGTAFVHGGLSPLVAEVGLDGINRKQVSTASKRANLLITLRRSTF